ncbi:TetR/AcrR family transcriptional regulator [[Mycobacterium] holstebronense]|uniref:TetR/AcrR family transcriptional regulator n=1 Tax=[Mycobacterium] holstebronense TaxID=3064288 RepID=A0ABM9LH89_9MYCO|nr:TetR/AcrR family transcriptional regulator [Mycolicibacter sp. MU0102]CAJ1498977.1 TetR/AcrR family transcriptional regulator [Mycolicibacter sp. MU0102]
MAYIKATEREGQIVAAAMRVLRDVGVAGTTLRGVAAEAGIPLGTLHYVFPSKDLLLRAVIAAVMDDVVDAVRADLQLDRGVAHALRQGVTNFWTTLVESDTGLQIMQYELAMYSVRSEGSGGLAQLQYERYTALVTEFCSQAAQAAGERCAVDFDSLGRLALALVDGLIVQYVTNPDSERARRDLDRAVDMVVRFADPQPVGKRPRRTG